MGLLVYAIDAWVLVWTYLRGTSFLPRIQHGALPVTGPNRFSSTREILETRSQVLRVALPTPLAAYFAQFKEPLVAVLPDRLHYHWQKEDWRGRRRPFLHHNDPEAGRVHRNLRQPDFR
jgi:hypothetical protein